MTQRIKENDDARQTHLHRKSDSVLELLADLTGNEGLYILCSLAGFLAAEMDVPQGFLTKTINAQYNRVKESKKR